MTDLALNEFNRRCSSSNPEEATAGNSVNEIVNDIVEDLRRFPKPEFLHVHENSLGSPYVAFRASSEVVNGLAGQDVIKAFRRVVLDPVRGLIMLMAPSTDHEDLAEELDAATKEVATQLGLKKRNLRQNRWKPEGGGDNTGDEADNCYYFGKKVDSYEEEYDQGTHSDYAKRTPPDLVVEVTVSHFDEDKIAAYRALDVPEYWQVKVANKAVEITFLDLQAQPSPSPLSASGELGGLTTAALLDCLKIRSSRYEDPREYGQCIRQVLIDHGIIPTGDHDGGGSPSPPPPP